MNDQNQNTTSEQKPKKFSVFRVCIGLAVAGLLAVLFLFYSFGAFLPLFVNLRHTGKDIKLYDSTNDTVKAKELFQKNGVKIDENKEIISNYETPIFEGQPGQTNVKISLKYQNLPIFSRTETLLFDKNGKFIQEQDDLGYRNLVYTVSEANGFVIPESARNAGSAILGDGFYIDPLAIFYDSKDYLGIFLASIKNNLPSVEPKISYQQALNRALDDKYFASAKTAGYSAQLGLFEKEGKKANEFQGSLVWKIRTNDKQLVTGRIGEKGLSEYFAYVNANTGEFIEDNRR